MERTYGLKSRYFMIYEGDTPVVLCPFFESNLRKWKGLASLPVGDISYLLTNKPSDKEATNVMLKRAMEIAKDSRLSHILLINSSSEARDSVLNTCPLLKKNALEYPAPTVPILDLEKHNPTDIWDNVFNSKKSQRKYINRFEQAGYEMRESVSQSDLDIFYKYYLDNVNFIKGKAVDRSHIDAIFKEYADGSLRMTLLQKDEVVAGGLIAFLYPPRKTMYLRHMALNRSLPSTYHPPYSLFWDAVNYAYDHGFRYVCFGSSSADPDVRSHQIKMGFGCDYLDNYGELISMSPLFGAVYKTYMWSREMRNQDQ